ncbi:MULTISPECIES: hypothetical protein [unclassified Caballeronia]|uniref:hypothetical protein n=1 Tax=unclassified Caballeronia TaxID=2646786 RepID=UPI00285A1CD7|nr:MULTISPECIES: hypothetical protein [unclassified Caballeronia]MDR5739601.1 hypothetical protein [Caballeronia sp. LZ016]MDR5808068.1 hypothetical protein [Caballeronia sp. LZ019]
MDARSNTSNTRFAEWMDDSEAPGDTTAHASHRSSQVSAEPEYVAEICGRFAGEKAEEEQKSCVVRGYN